MKTNTYTAFVWNLLPWTNKRYPIFNPLGQFASYGVYCEYIYYRLSRYTIYIYINIYIYMLRYRLWTHERYPYIALTSEPWVSFVSYLEKSDREISGVHCILEAFGRISLYMNQCSDVWSNRWNRNSELRNFSRYTILRCKNDMFLPWLPHRSGQVIESYAMGSKSNASWHKILFRHALIIFLVLLTCLTCINKKPWPT